MSKLITVEKIVNRGSGMGYDENNKVVFIPFTAVGDVVKTEIVTNKKSFEIGKIESIETKSEDRIDAVCPHFSVCGGCSYQHISYEKELELKKRLGFDIFNADFGDVYSSGNDLEYRNKVSFHASYKSGALTLGFMMAGSNRQVNIDKCYLVPNYVNDLKNKIEALNIQTLKQVVLRFDEHNKNLIINFIGKDKKGVLPKLLKKNRDMFERIQNDEGIKVHISKFINSEKLDKTSFEVSLNKVQYRVSADDFFQVNYKVAAEIYKDIRDEVAKDTSVKTVVDGFCGSMTIGLQFKDMDLEKIYGIEINEASVKQAKDNVSINKTKDIKVLKGDFNKLIKGIEVDFTTSILVVDPPRDGIGAETMKFINTLGFKKVVYLSCDQMTLKRDAAELTDYTLDFSRVYDMFPRTFHVETLFIFKKK